MTATALQEIDVALPRRKWPNYSGYRPSGMTWLRHLPEHWRILRLKNIASVRFSSVDKKTEDGENPVRLCNYTDVYNNDRIVDDPEFMQATATADEIARFTLKKGDVLITKDSEEWNDIAVPAYVTADMPGVLCGYHLAHIRPHPTSIDGAYLSRAFTADGIRQQFHIAANGITRYGLPNRAIVGALFPVPPLDEQQMIAAFLDSETTRIDELIAKKTRLLQRIDEKWVACLTRMVTRGINTTATLRTTGVLWCELMPDTWRFLPLRRFIDRIEQGWSPQADQRTADDDEWAVLKVGAVLRGRFRSEEHKALPPALEPETRFVVKEGDLLLTRGNTPELVADVCIVPGTRPRLLLSDLHYRLTLDESNLSKPFACYWLLSRSGRYQIEADAHGTSNSMVKMSQQHIRSWLVPVPPREEQDVICIALDGEKKRLDVVTDRINQAIRRLEEHRSALITAAVTGQIDVRHYGKEAT